MFFSKIVVVIIILCSITFTATPSSAAETRPYVALAAVFRPVEPDPSVPYPQRFRFAETFGVWAGGRGTLITKVGYPFEIPHTVRTQLEPPSGRYDIHHLWSENRLPETLDLQGPNFKALVEYYQNTCRGFYPSIQRWDGGSGVHIGYLIYGHQYFAKIVPHGEWGTIDANNNWWAMDVMTGTVEVRMAPRDDAPLCGRISFDLR